MKIETLLTQSEITLNEDDVKTLHTDFEENFVATLEHLLAKKNPDVDKGEALERWRKKTTDTLFTTLVNMIQFGAITELPAPKRAPLTMEVLFGDYRPYQIDADEIAHAISVANSADEVVPLDVDERSLLTSLLNMQDAGTNYSIWISETNFDTYLNDQIPHDIPSWLNDNMDWERLYNQVRRTATSVHLDGEIYYEAPAD